MTDVGEIRRPFLSRILLAGLAIPAIEIGVWASVAPKSWFDGFPGGNRHWVQVDGPYNEHLVRDVGALYLGMAIVTVAALVTLRPMLVRIAAWALLVSGAPHLLYHLRHLSLYDTADKIGNVVSLSLGVLAPLVLLLVWRSGPDAASLEHAPKDGGTVGHDSVHAKIE